MDERIQRLSEKARDLPKSPGVYLMKDIAGHVIYVGKSASLRDRVSSYFQAATKLDFKKAPLLDYVVDFDVIQTDSEVEALLAENRLIKDIQPRYNARLLDDKTYPYLMITTGEDFPGVYVTREPKTKGAKLYGPFTSVYALKEAVTLLQKAFKFRTCHLEIREGDDRRRFFRPCLLYPIHQCTAPCAAKIPQDTYAEDIGRLIKFLDGQKKTVISNLEKEMIEASKDLHFERAGRLRDEIKALERWGAGREEGPGILATRVVRDESEGGGDGTAGGAGAGGAAQDYRGDRHCASSGGRDGGEQGLFHRRGTIQGLLPAVQDQAWAGEQ